MRIGFHTNSLSFRGAEIAVFDYALHNQSLLQNESLVFYKSHLPSEPSVVEKFSQHFKLLPYQTHADLARLADQEKIDLLYFIKSGERDGDIISNVPCAVHAVFPTKPAEFHGDKLAFVSQWLAKEYSNHKIPFVPHMIDLPNVQEDLRVELNIPKHATVIASYGGSDSFNLPFVHETIVQVLAQRKDLYFIFMNFAPFAQHERLIFLPGNSDMHYKMRFINTADGMIHARGIGESFGLACGEFSIKNKPVMTYAFSPQRSHIEILGDKALLYQGKKDLAQILLNFNPQVQHERNWDAYSTNFLPTAVMNKFKKVFLSSDAQDLRLSPLDKLSIQRYRLERKIRNLSKKMYL
ncbi:hypothetical protein G6725_00925 [Polynucleobacter paneuropaeus]|uniref:Uncharacterized protein n=1 Tax=Polynucleobacter paneuropaeus TaxID=2527775 RepID=A0AAE2YLL5_9BURK|nr:hypothetical protein [Polynucleobacter paneuropaeus]MBT8515470.1 hypothetical protein [Polynucleobacter paneuropaeus]MBT8523601.1 hypothetical protein [Polynucleobacter paneuropaeus]MBT8526764.1 hypothetical protein [Polynucleobacter paneuropaeus]MBT8533426.1 hypothetical protein [Polynucleobacter paneuropaeus]MBT8534571.1 hypothetical protein [Polynucleobacter paneuropaeus]